MSFFDLDNTANTSEDKIKYIYTGSTVNNQDIAEHSNDEQQNSLKKKDIPDTEGELIPIKNTYYKINYINKEPNFIYAGISPSAYIANTLYLYGLLHRNISGVTTKRNTDIIGEIVIEHTNANKQAQRVFTCFLIQQRDDKMTDNSIDSLVKMISGDSNNNVMTVELSTIIPSQSKCVHYVDEENHIFIFTKPILVNKDAATFFKNNLANETKLFKVYPPVDYSIIHLGKSKSKSNQEGFTIQEGMDDIYIDCNPTGESDETIQAYAVPIDSEYGNSKNQIDFFKMMINFGVFLIISIITYFTIPPFYKHIVVDKLNTEHATKEPKERQQFIYIADLWIIAIFLISILDAFWGGLATDADYSLIQYGIGLCVVLIIGYSLIQLNKLHSIFMTTNIGTDEIDSSYSGNPEDYPTIGGPQNVGEFFKELYLKPVFTDGKKFAKIAVIFLLMLMIPGAFITAYGSETAQDTWLRRLLPASIFVLTPMVYLSSS